MDGLMHGWMDGCVRAYVAYLAAMSKVRPSVYLNTCMAPEPHTYCPLPVGPHHCSL